MDIREAMEENLQLEVYALLMEVAVVVMEDLEVEDIHLEMDLIPLEEGQVGQMGVMEAQVPEVQAVLASIQLHAILVNQMVHYMPVEVAAEEL